MGPVIRDDQREIKYLHVDQVQRLFDAIESDRDRLLFGLIYTYGLRASEAAGLTMGAVDLERGRITIRALKGGLTNTYSLEADLLRLLRRWVKAERAEATDAAPLFATRQSEGITRKRIGQLFALYAKRAGVRLQPGMGPHSLRHSAAVHALDSGLESAEVRDLLRHQSSRSTDVYARVSSAKRAEYQRVLSRSDRVARIGR